MQVNRVASQVRARENRIRMKLDPSNRLPKLPHSKARYGPLKSKEEKKREARERYGTNKSMWSAGLPTRYKQMRAYFSKLLR